MEEKYELQALQAPCTGEAWEKHGSAYSLVDTHTNYKNTHTHIDRQELKVNVMTSLTGLLTRRFLQRTLRNKKGGEVINLVSVALKHFDCQCVRR